MGGWVRLLKEPVIAMATKVWGYIPNVLAAAVILAVGLVLSKFIARIIGRVLKLSRIDVVSEKSGLAGMLKIGEIKLSLSEILETLIYWILVLIVAATAAQALKFMAATDLITRLIAYIPNIISAILVLAIGIFLASLLGSLVLAATRNAGIKKANFLTQIVKTALIILAIAIALEQLQIGQVIITQVLSIILISIGAGFAIAFGLGCKDTVGRMVNDFLNSFK
ncbi:MAG: hypothetical protein PHO42_03195 [Candidatus Omnitrophica bacterium]|nr:hypothetical protein [Candidatus Omnitrophota bacterium]